MQFLYQSRTRISNMITLRYYNNQRGVSAHSLLFLNPESNPDTNHPTPKVTTARRDKVTGDRELFRCEYFRG